MLTTTWPPIQEGLVVPSLPSSTDSYNYVSEIVYFNDVGRMISKAYGTTFVIDCPNVENLKAVTVFHKASVATGETAQSGTWLRNTTATSGTVGSLKNIAAALRLIGLSFHLDLGLKRLTIKRTASRMWTTGNVGTFEANYELEYAVLYYRDNGED